MFKITYQRRDNQIRFNTFQNVLKCCCFCNVISKPIFFAAAIFIGFITVECPVNFVILWKNMKNSNLTKYIGIYITICVAALLLPLMFYICRFCGNPVGNPADWGSFGSFYGGILTPIITVIIISITLLSLLSNEKDNKHKERKVVYENLFNYSLLMNEAVSDFLLASSLFKHDEKQNRACSILQNNCHIPI